MSFDKAYKFIDAYNVKVLFRSLLGKIIRSVKQFLFCEN